MKRQPPDNRLDWRNPNMPLLRKRLDTGEFAEISSKDIHEYYQIKIYMDIGEPEWKDDPTYELEEKKKMKTDKQIKKMFNINEEEKDWLDWGNIIETSRGEWRRICYNQWVFHKYLTSSKKRAKMKG